MSAPATAAGAALTRGFGNLVLDSQACFRAALEAMSRPGTVRTIAPQIEAPAPLDPATMALALTLLDADTRVWLDGPTDTEAVRGALRFHCGASLDADPGAADFALITDGGRCPPLDSFVIGDDQYPDRSATVILQVDALDGGAPGTLCGPGVDGAIAFAPRGLAPDFAARWAANHALFPLGVDLFLTAGRQLVGLPRSVAWEA